MAFDGGGRGATQFGMKGPENALIPMGAPKAQKEDSGIIREEIIIEQELSLHDEHRGYPCFGCCRRRPKCVARHRQWWWVLGGRLWGGGR